MDLDESSVDFLKKSKSANLSIMKGKHENKFSDSIQHMDKVLTQSQP